MVSHSNMFMFCLTSATLIVNFLIKGLEGGGGGGHKKKLIPK